MDLIKELPKLLKNRSFISVATASKDGEPHNAPKFIFKIDGKILYLIDHAMAKSAENLRENPRASISFMDLENLEGYRLNGSVELIESGEAHKKIAQEFEKKLIQLSATRFIEGMKSGKKSEHFELEMPERFIVFKVTVRDAVRISRQGDVRREKMQ